MSRHHPLWTEVYIQVISDCENQTTGYPKQWESTCQNNIIRKCQPSLNTKQVTYHCMLFFSHNWSVLTIKPVTQVHQIPLITHYMFQVCKSTSVHITWLWNYVTCYSGINGVFN
jgi:hypothetical protein